jgi:glycosyltransferase involved in cell wall biosynthesis
MRQRSPDEPLPRRLCEPTISVVMPAYDEAANLAATLGQLSAALRCLSSRWEIVLVDDGSRDATPELMAAPPAGVRYLRLTRNFGKEAALTAGLAHTRGELVWLMDADGQHPVELMPAMLQAWREGADHVCAVRRARDDESWFKRAGTRWFYRLVNVGSPVPITADAGDFRLFDRRVVDALNSLPERNRFMKGLYAWVGFEPVLIAYTPLPRHAGTSRFSPLRLARLALTGITAFSNLPLRLWSALGAGVACCALGYGIWVVVEHVVAGHPVPGWPTIVAGMMFTAGVQLLSIGVLGEYVGRIFDEVKQRPVYLLAADSGAPPLEEPLHWPQPTLAEAESR